MFRTSIRLGAFAALFVASSLSAASAYASTWYVRADATLGGNGASWANAFDTLPAGIAAANASDMVWVKTGTYRPGNAASPRTATFQPKNGVAVYGGFSGSETALAQRDWIANPTVLSGDLLLDDGPDFTNRGDNVYHVVSALGVNASAVLDGFVVRGGNANGAASWQGYGGGILGANATLRNLNVIDNEAYAGGGLALPDGAWNPSPIVGCVFRDNRAVSGGGGLLLEVPSFALYECVVTANAAGQFGGGIDIELAAQWTASVANCLIVGNHAQQGSGGVRSQWCELTVTNTTIAYNHADAGIGGMSGGGQPYAAVTLANSIAWGNTSGGNPHLNQLSSAIVLVQTAVEGGSAPLNLDPRFVDAFGTDGIVGTEDDDFRLSCVSPYIDRGSNAYAAGIVLDLAGHPRFVDDPATPDQGSGSAPIVDLGPYEFVCGCDQIGTYCTAIPNTSGAAASISASGSTSLFANSLVLHVAGGPPLKSGIFFYGSLQNSVPWGDGILCVGGSLFRLPISTLDATGTTSFAFDVTQPPAASGPGQVFEGSTWNFQYYFRDPTGGPAGWNASNALSVEFCR